MSFEHGPEKLADFSDKIMRPSKKEHGPEKLAGFADKTTRQDNKKQSAIDST